MTTSSQSTLESPQMQQLDRLAKLLDSQFSIGGFRFGLDGLIGLIPGVGDMAGGIVSLLVIFRVRQLGVSDAAANRMLWYILLDVAIGTIPLLGDAFDFFFKVNERNLRLARADFQRQANHAVAIE